MAAEDVDRNRRLGAIGATLLKAGSRVLTHCNTGALACVGYGTALGVIRAAHESGMRPSVWVDETRPVLQGSRLTAWELDRLGIPATVVVDSAAGSLMARGQVDCVIVGADCIAANGDVANKVGTYCWQSWLDTIIFRSTWPRPPPPSIWPARPGRRSRWKNAAPAKWPPSPGAG